MLHPSYTDLMNVVNHEVEQGEAPVVNSRYSIVLATSKRARQIIAGVEPTITKKCPKPLSIAIDELYNSKIRILSEEEAAAQEAAGEQTAVEDDGWQQESEISSSDDTQED